MKLTAEVVGEVAQRLASGCDLATAGRACGVSATDMSGWIHDAHVVEEKPPRKLSAHQTRCVELLEASRTARAEVEVKSLAIIQRDAMAGQWQAAAWLLERLEPDKYLKQKAEGHGGVRPGAGHPKGKPQAPDRVLRAVKAAD